MEGSVKPFPNPLSAAKVASGSLESWFWEYRSEWEDKPEGPPIVHSWEDLGVKQMGLNFGLGLGFIEPFFYYPALRLKKVWCKSQSYKVFFGLSISPTQFTFSEDSWETPCSGTSCPEWIVNLSQKEHYPYPLTSMATRWQLDSGDYASHPHP